MCDLDAILNYDTVELAFLLKAIGFQIKSFEFTKINVLKEKSVEIDLCCNTSGFKAKFVLVAEKCTCPPRPLENNNSFWEIQGRAPPSPGKPQPSIIKDASCTVLPEISKKTAGLARSVLHMLLEEHRKELLAIQGNSTNISDGNKSFEEGQTNNFRDDQNLSPAFGHIKTETGSKCFSTPLNFDGKLKTEVYKKDLTIPKMLTTDTEERVSTQPQNSNDVISPDLAAYVSPSVVFPSPQLSRSDNGDQDRNIFIIEAIQNARKDLDAALLHLKCSIMGDFAGTLPTKITPGNSKIKTRLLGVERLQKKPIKSISRRATVRSLSDSADKDSKVSEPVGKPLARKPLSGSTSIINTYKSQIPRGAKLATKTVKSVQAQVDVPRPRFDMKRYAESGIKKSLIVRSATTTNLKSSSSPLAKVAITKQKSALN